MQYKYKTQGTCSREITIDINDDETIESVSFLGGCNGNLQGIGALVKGRKIDEVIKTLKGIDCNFRGTSCPDQLARALEQIKAQG
ncbi:MAG: TIGR03905 family TSCPD domain-containing protein [Eubacterium sp.]|nr:TIGR03905 family TSCPD domain-containing protein [Eubacterium sp.]MBR4241978.1 TIGR03905 family TSCPD domain-containing protein [Eubacterium sp.]MBR7060728.1 TIGR03905 family TSCPD domain-containing protein [Eubacterium sp.]